MFPVKVIIILSTALVANSATSAGSTKSNCTITNFSDVLSVVSNCTNIVISNLYVPGGKCLELDLRTGSVVIFEGTTTFGHFEWNGPLVNIKGDNITVEGASGSRLDGQGALYWDGLGGAGSTKPYFFRIETTGGSIFENVYLLNCPHHCTIIEHSVDLLISGWTIDVSAGDEGEKGHNTDGFDVVSGSNIIVENSTVINQDDCLVVNQGSNMLFRNLNCSGSHGLSLSVGFNKTSFFENSVSNITFTDCQIAKSQNGIHLKTHTDGGYGAINNITYRKIKMAGITNYGINIQEDYMNGTGTGIPRGNIPITNLFLTNVTGTVADTKGHTSRPVYIFCATNACSNFTFSGVEIKGGSRNSSCNYSPIGYSCA